MQNTPKKKVQKGIQTSEPIRSKKEIEAIKNYLGGKSIRNKTLFVVGINSALRISDLLRLKLSDVIDENFKINKSIRILEKKTKKMKTFPVNKSMKEALEKYIDTMEEPMLSDYIFQSREGENKAITSQMVWEIFQDIKENIKTDTKLSSHSMRKTFCYHAWKSGVPLETLMELLNHNSLRTTKIYIGISQDEINEVYHSVNL